MTSPIKSPLLTGLSPDQQRLVDLVADAFVAEDYEWPMFQYLEWVLDEEKRDAWEILRSFAYVGRWGYGPVAWIRSSPAMKPTPETEVALTVAGVAQSSRLRAYLETFFSLLEYMAEERRAARPSPRKIVEPVASSEGFARYWRANRRLDMPHPRLTWQLLEREPPGFFGGRSYDPDSHTWTRTVPREILELEGIRSVDDYLTRLERWLAPPDPVPSFSSPAIPLPTAIDHLDDVWRLAFGSRLFQLTGAERLASLTEDVSSRDEYEARLSVMSDLLRSANAAVAPGGGKRPRDRLAGLSEKVASRVEEGGRGRVADAMLSLEAVLALRDSRQHGGASHRAMAAAQRLGLPYPTSDWGEAWRAVSGRTVQALSVIGDELRTTID